MYCFENEYVGVCGVCGGVCACVGVGVRLFVFYIYCMYCSERQLAFFVFC